MRFLIDRCAGHRVAVWLRERGHDVAEARERGKDPGDAIILRWAAAEDRILITIDTDFGELIFLRGAPHCGMIRLPDVPASQRLGLLDELLARHADDLAAKAVITVRGSRIRVARTGT